ncbi:FAD-dependent oxidoreductase [Epibacterium sp. Ofav1-8]|uniref:FAD-dependent oxidoreductase n=1 Tax=Epibacterium sp. Ofav1-8 TaxID=2917735 RepID=UPI001EF41A7F|nr:hypothetical protein [Epibacterium sp. Ofav1-8]MCG7622232.1 hypothetical protein [Epibacterium sp. Ofav1-8]
MALPQPSTSPPPRGMHPERPRAVVIGGGIAGLAACSALAPHAASIILIEPDGLPDGATYRRRIPQAPHVHALLDSGRQALEQLMPGIGAALQRAGSLPLKVRSQWRTHDGHEWCTPEDTGPMVLSQSRPLLEQALRQRVRRIPHLTLMSGRVRGLVTQTGEDPHSARITGVHVQDTAQPPSTPDRPVPADIVIDASGRAGDSLKWLAAASGRLPPEDTRTPDIRYCSAFFDRTAQDGSTALSAWLRPAQAPGTRSLVMAPVEHNRWIITLTGRFGAQMPRDEQSFRQLFEAIAGAELSARLADAPMVSRLRGFAIKTVRFRRFDHIAEDLPVGYFPIGDTIATFNPLFGQGMSVAALQALSLHNTLTRQPDLAMAQSAYLQEACRTAGWAWNIGGAVDRAYPQMRQQPDAECDHLAERLRLAFSASVMRPAMRGQIDRVLHLLDPPDRLDVLCSELAE